MSTATIYGTTPTATQWLWPNLIPLGKITLLAGDPGLGKSFISLDLAARLSTAQPMPHAHDSGLKTQPSPTILLSAEDGLQDTIRPRILAQNGNPALILPLRALDARNTQFKPFSLKTGLRLLDIFLEKSQAKFLILDPITSFMQGIDHNSTSQIRQHLTPLAQLAFHRNTAVLAITHLSKRSQHHTLYRATGSLALAAIARSILLVHPSPDRSHNQLSLIKSNLSVPQPSLPFQITNGQLQWLPIPSCSTAPPFPQDSNLTPQDSDFTTPNAYDFHDRQFAIEFLRDALKDGPQPAAALFREARKLAISEKTLKRAKAQLGVVSQKSGLNEWQWCMTLP